MRSFQIKSPVYINSGFTVVGPKEGDGNFGDFFDIVIKDDLWCEKSYEKCECKMHKTAILGAIRKAGLDINDVGLMLGGDLLNELSSTSLAVRHFPIAFLGLYNACSTFSEAIIIGSMLISGGFCETVACSTSSHYSSAERQYRFPLELGNQRPPTAQWTVTGAGCSILSSKKPTKQCQMVGIDELLDFGNEIGKDEKERAKYEKLKSKQRALVNDDKSNIFEQNFSKESNDYALSRAYVARITGGTIGRIVDLGIDDEANMGAAMAPAACDTILTHFRETGRSLEYYDGIFTGDLGRFGKETLKYLLSKEGIDLPDYYMDTGASYFTPEQKTFQGGSGAGCVNTAFNGYILKKLQTGDIRRALIVPTGALLNKDTPLQKETIPGIAHAFTVEAEELEENGNSY